MRVAHATSEDSFRRSAIFSSAGTKNSSHTIASSKKQRSRTKKDQIILFKNKAY
jgi:hypothetical protein